MTDDGLCTACAPNLPHRRAEFPPRHRRLAHGQLASVRCCAPRRGTSVDKRDGWTIQRSPARSLLHAADAARLQSAHPSWTNATPQPPRFHPVIMPRDAVEFAFRARDLGNDVVSPAVDRGSESDPVAAVKDLEANEKKPRGGGFGELKMALPKMPRSAAWSPRSKASKPSTRLATFAGDDPLGCEHALARNHQDADQAYGYAVTGIVTISSCAVCQATTGEKR